LVVVAEEERFNRIKHGKVNNADKFPNKRLPSACAAAD
jgi:hypothetical protein